MAVDPIQPALSSLFRHLFECTWEDLDEAALGSFLKRAGTGDEGLTWEAKGGRDGGAADPRGIQRTVAAFGNSRLGGFLIIGAQRPKPKTPWELPGCSFVDEPAMWTQRVVGQIIGPPEARYRVVELANGRLAVVVAVTPHPTPPVITPLGEVFERVTGESVPVRDPAQLRALFEGGERARQRAEAAARATFGMLQAEPFLPGPSDRGYPVSTLVVAIGPTGTTPRLLMTEAFADRLWAVLNEPSRRWRDLDTRMGQRSLRGWTASSDGLQGWSVRADDSGAVALAHWDDGESSMFPGARQAGGSFDVTVRTVDGLVGAMGGHGPAFVVAYVHRGLHTQAWTIVGQPSDAIAAMIRELRRGAGEIVWEP